MAPAIGRGYAGVMPDDSKLLTGADLVRASQEERAKAGEAIRHAQEMLVEHELKRREEARSADEASARLRRRPGYLGPR